MTPQQAAQWMLDELNRAKVLDQEHAAWQLHEANPDLTYQNDNGNLAIGKNVLTAFNRITKGDDVVWSRSERQWRFRHAHDAPGRMQD